MLRHCAIVWQIAGPDDDPAACFDREQLGRRGLKLLPQQDGQRLFTAALGRPEPVLVPIALTRAGSEALLRKLHPQSSPQRQVDRSPLSRILERPAKEHRAAHRAQWHRSR